MKKELQDFYQKYPCGGDWLKDDLRYKRLPWWKEIFEFDQHKGELLLDAGCGTGIDLCSFSGNGSSVIGVDIAKRPLEIARQRISKKAVAKAYLLRCDIECLSFKGCTFNMVYSIGVLHHTPNFHLAIQEMQRVLKPGGKVIALLYHKNSFFYIFIKLQRSLKYFGLEKFVRTIFSKRMNPARYAAFKEMLEHPLIKFFTKNQVIKIFRGSGLIISSLHMFDSLYPFNRFLLRKYKDPLKEYFGRFIIVKACKAQDAKMLKGGT